MLQCCSAEFVAVLAASSPNSCSLRAYADLWKKFEQFYQYSMPRRIDTRPLSTSSSKLCRSGQGALNAITGQQRSSMEYK